MKKNIRLVSLTFLACWQAASNSSVSATQAQQGPKASPPILVTSCGQSEGPSSLNTILKRIRIWFLAVPAERVSLWQFPPPTIARKYKSRLKEMSRTA
jgi:hypothetical protein